MFHDVKQNTDEWLDLRAGKVTGSSIGKVMANYPKSFGEPAKKLAVEIAIHRLTGNYSINSYTNAHMERGHEQEPIARTLYQNTYFYDVSNGGFFDNGFTGCSPDGLVDNDGLIEIKSVIATTHFATLKRNEIDPGYKWQCLFNLNESGRQWIDYVSFCMEFPENKRLFVKRKTIKDFGQDYRNMIRRIGDFENLVYDTQQFIKTI